MLPQYFERRELKPYAEPISADDLRLGEVYFGIVFSDDRMIVPRLTPLVFVGIDLEDHGSERHLYYFQDVESHALGESIEDEEAVIVSAGADNLSSFFEFSKALDVLLSCSLRRDKIKSQTSSRAGRAGASG
jgi:hypothetical protein